MMVLIFGNQHNWTIPACNMAMRTPKVRWYHVDTSGRRC